MDFEYICHDDDKVIVKNVRNFELSHIFDCGQCFRWEKQTNGNYIGIAYNRVIEVKKDHNDVIIYNSNEYDFKNIWSQYFDLYRDYSTIKDSFNNDEMLKKSVDFGNGVRILQQEPFEILISFIISANNRIPMIKRAIKKIAKKFGNKIMYKGEEYYTFPSAKQLKNATIEELEQCSTGFRAKYIKSTIDKINNNEIDLNMIKKLNDDDCHKELMKFDGVGPKVSDCIMLFSMQKYSAFPVDVWVKRAMQKFYLAPNVSLKKIRDFGRDKFGIFSGFAQQYLFYYARENNIKIQ